MHLILSIQTQTDAQMDPADAAAVRELLSSLKVEQHKDRAVISASVPLELLRRIMSRAAAAATPTAQH